jgi:hypothetical protein
MYFQRFERRAHYFKLPVDQEDAHAQKTIAMLAYRKVKEVHIDFSGAAYHFEFIV